MKLLNGSELAGYIKERQTKQVRSLKQGRGIEPKLAIIATIDDPVIQTYVRLKKRYGEEIGVEVDILQIDQSELLKEIQRVNTNDSFTGLIVQLPLADTSQTEEATSLVALAKDVDGLNPGGSKFLPATPQAIEWLIDGYNIDMRGKQVAMVGQGKLVGAPLTKMLEARGVNVQVFEEGVGDLQADLPKADVVISATGVPGLITADLLKQGAVAVDAGVATAGAKTVGDFADDVYERDDLTITPKKGGVGPLTVTALFENLLRASAELG